MEEKEERLIIEALLFISGESLTIDTIKKLTEIDKQVAEEYLRELATEYSARNSGVMITEVAGGYQMVTNPAAAPWVKKLLSTSVPKRLSPPSLETLAIVAYKQPIIKAEIEAIRGVNSDGVVKTLLERRLIKILGRKEVPGRPLLYGTTQDFLQYFGLKDLSELPTLKEFQEVDIPEIPEMLPEESTSSDDLFAEEPRTVQSDDQPETVEEELSETGEKETETQGEPPRTG